MKYSIKDFRREFSSEDKCLNYMFRFKYPGLKQYYRVKGRKCFAHSMTGKQIHPLAGTIFHKSSTPLTMWFEAIFLFSISKNGVSAKEIQRHFGVTYKTAWRMGQQIRSLLGDDGKKLKGVVEADETYIGGVSDSKNKFKSKSSVLGLVERGGSVKVTIADQHSNAIFENIKKNVEPGTTVMTDGGTSYRKEFGYANKSVIHSKREFARGEVHINTIESFWSQFKRSLRGTYHSVSKKHLQAYLDEFSFRYSHRDLFVFDAMLRRI